jgi:hypothetical protein
MLKAAKMDKVSMGWWDIIFTALGGFAGGLATEFVSSYIFGVVSKPRFEYLGITGNQVPYGTTQYLQCAARFRIKGSFPHRDYPQLTTTNTNFHDA